jgi:hypothetical protein
LRDGRAFANNADLRVAGQKESDATPRNRFIIDNECRQHR